MPLLPALVVFDLAGTTIEDHDVVAGCLADATRAVGVPIGRARANAVMGLPKPGAIARLLAEHEGGVPPALDSARVRAATSIFETAIVRHYRSPGAVVPIPGVENVLDALKCAGVKIAIDTGFSSAVLGTILDLLGWLTDGRVDVSVASDEVGRGRPFPDLLFEAMRRCGVTDVRTVAKVGDTPADLAEGTSAGCGWVVGVTYGTHARTELSDHAHTVLIDDIRELPDVLGLRAVGFERLASRRPRPPA